MRAILIALTLAGLASAAAAQDAPPTRADGPSPFPVERGAAPPPGVGAGMGQTPPEGRAAGGFDFGAWRAAEPAAYERGFQAQVTTRYGGRNAGEVRADLEANGFACEDVQRLDCRIELVEGACAFDWYVVIERTEPAPIAGFDQVCRRRG